MNSDGNDFFIERSAIGYIGAYTSSFPPLSSIFPTHSRRRIYAIEVVIALKPARSRLPHHLSRRLEWGGGEVGWGVGVTLRSR